jgi:hypothetical protein
MMVALSTEMSVNFHTMSQKTVVLGKLFVKIELCLVLKLKSDSETGSCAPLVSTSRVSVSYIAVLGYVLRRDQRTTTNDKVRKLN